jgi:uncharacterized repeat protein (TIGR01451 family)
MYNATGSTASVCGADTVTIGGTSPYLVIWKRITQIVRTYGYATPQTITPTPDPTSSPGLNGTASTLGIDPGDILTYTLYFSNQGTGSACGTGSTTSCVGGPTINDLLSPNYTYVSGSNTFTCCSYPTLTTSATFSSTQQGNGLMLQWVLATPLPASSPSPSIQGNITYQVKVP